jgi:hypothetical protein
VSDNEEVHRNSSQRYGDLWPRVSPASTVLFKYAYAPFLPNTFTRSSLCTGPTLILAGVLIAAACLAAGRVWRLKRRLQPVPIAVD